MLAECSKTIYSNERKIVKVKIKLEIKTNASSKAVNATESTRVSTGLGKNGPGKNGPGDYWISSRIGKNGPFI